MKQGELALALDGSGADIRAFWVATRLAQRFRLPLFELSVAVPPVTIQEQLGEVRRHAHNPFTVRVTEDESVSKGIVRLLDGAVPVLASRANPYTQDSFRGSVAEQVCALSPTPVVLVGPDVDSDLAWEVDEVVVPVADVLDMREAIPPATRWASMFDVPVRCVYVAHELESPDSSPAEALAGVQVMQATKTSPARAISDTVGPKSLLIMPTHARQGLDRIINGSVLCDVLAEAEQPVVAIGPNAGPSVAPFA